MTNPNNPNDPKPFKPAEPTRPSEPLRPTPPLKPTPPFKPSEPVRDTEARGVAEAKARMAANVDNDIAAAAKAEAVAKETAKLPEFEAYKRDDVNSDYIWAPREQIENKAEDGWRACARGAAGSVDEAWVLMGKPKATVK